MSMGKDTKPVYQVFFNGKKKILVLTDQEGNVQEVYGNTNVRGLQDNRKDFNWKGDGRYFWKDVVNGN